MSGVLLALVLTAQAAPANPPPVPLRVRAAIGRATVVVLPARCTGVLVGSPWLVATARHCVGTSEHLRVRGGGLERAARVVAQDEEADQVVLLLDEPFPHPRPLEVARRIPIVGTVLYFRGNPLQPIPRWQAARLDQVGVCPTLPTLRQALFTSIAGVPGDSGAPLVDILGRVVGLVHGGTQCRIATPSVRLAPLVDRALEQYVPDQNPLIAPGEGASPTS